MQLSSNAICCIRFLYTCTRHPKFSSCVTRKTHWRKTCPYTPLLPPLLSFTFGCATNQLYLGQMRFSHCVRHVFFTWHPHQFISTGIVNIAAVVVAFEWRSWYAIVHTPIQLSLISRMLLFLFRYIRVAFCWCRLLSFTFFSAYFVAITKWIRHWLFCSDASCGVRARRRRSKTTTEWIYAQENKTNDRERIFRKKIVKVFARIFLWIILFIANDSQIRGVVKEYAWLLGILYLQSIEMLFELYEAMNLTSEKSDRFDICDQFAKV